MSIEHGRSPLDHNVDEMSRRIRSTNSRFDNLKAAIDADSMNLGKSTQRRDWYLSAFEVDLSYFCVISTSGSHPP